MATMCCLDYRLNSMRSLVRLTNRCNANLMEHKPEPTGEQKPLIDSEPKVAAVEENVEALTVAASLNAKTLSALLKNRNFVPLLLGQLVSYIGDQFATIAALTVISRPE